MLKKQDKVYDEIKINFALKGKSRRDLRDATVLKFLKEKAGYYSSKRKQAIGKRV